MFHCTSVWKNIWVDALTHQCRQCDLSSQWTRLSHLLFIQWHMSTGHRLTLSSLFLASHINTFNYNTKISLSPLVGTIKVACKCRMTSESNMFILRRLEKHYNFTRCLKHLTVLKIKGDGALKGQKVFVWSKKKKNTTKVTHCWDMFLLSHCS